MMLRRVVGVKTLSALLWALRLPVKCLDTLAYATVGRRAIVPTSRYGVWATDDIAGGCESCYDPYAKRDNRHRYPCMRVWFLTVYGVM